MTSPIFCPVCQRKNNDQNKQCAYCGSSLQVASSGIGVHTTLNITPTMEHLQANSLCQDYLKQLSVGDICFILETKQTPVILKNVDETVLGRFFDESEENNLDLDPFGGGAYGVSRRHAKIVRVNNQYVFEDLNSTNGSWLNGQRLPSGTTYPLMNGDQIWLGQFKMQVCFQQAELAPQTIIFLQGATSSTRHLSPGILTLQIGPYLQAISDLQKIAAQCLQQESTEVIIDKIDASGTDSYIVVHITNSQDSIHLIRKWITPWRQEHQINAENPDDSDETKQAIVQLTSKIIADMSPDLNNESRFALIEETLPVITELAVGPIDLSFEAL